MISRFRNILIQPHKRELLKGSLITIIIKVAGMLVGYAFIMLLSRKYGAEAVGIYQISLQFITVMVTIALLGFNQAIIRFSSELVSKNYITELKKVIVKFSLVSFGLSMLFAYLTSMYASDLAVILLKDHDYANIFQVIAFAIPVFTLNLLFVELIRGLKKIKQSEFLRLFSTRFFNLIAFWFMIWIVDFDYLLPVLTYESALALTLCFSTCFLFRFLHEKSKFNIEIGVSARKYFTTSFTMYQSILLMMASGQLLTFVLAYYANPVEVGVYNVAFQIASLSTFIFASVTTITAPKYAELYYNDKIEFKHIVRFSSKLIFWTTGTVSLVVIILSKWLLGLFGEEFIVGTTILIILSLANFVNAFTGAGGVLLDMIGKQKIRRNILLSSTLTIIILSFILIPLYGSLGLALAIFANIGISNAIGVYYIHKYFGINLIYIPYITKVRG